MEIKRKFVLRNIAGDRLLVPAERASFDLNGMLTLNEVGAEIWTMLPEVNDAEEIVRRIVERYDATPTQVERDVAEFLAKLRGLGIL